MRVIWERLQESAVLGFTHRGGVRGILGTPHCESICVFLINQLDRMDEDSDDCRIG